MEVEFNYICVYKIRIRKMFKNKFLLKKYQ